MAAYGDSSSPHPGALRSEVARRLPWVFAILAGLAASGGVYWAVKHGKPAAVATSVPTGKATITSRPDGLEVVIDDQLRGNTPLTVTLPVGTHQMRVQSGAVVRVLPLIVESTRPVSQYLDLVQASGQAATDALETTPGPRGAGGTPQAVTAGKAPVGVAAPPRSVQPGWVTFTAPFEVRIQENGRVLGTTGRTRTILTAGSHRLDLVNEQLEFQTTLTVQVAAGVATTSAVTVPNGSLSLNALPWADVQIDGRAAGTTPLANLPVPVGSHEIVWTNPRFGERRQTVTVKAKTPTRVGIDFGQ